MPDIEKLTYRSLLLSNLIKNRTDEVQRSIIERFTSPLEFNPLHTLMISPTAWARTQEINADPKLVFAHPVILQEHPMTSLYYRGMSLLSQKSVLQHSSVNVAGWEKGVQTRKVPRSRCERVARLYNAIISCIIEGSSDWSLDNGYRNILATMGISLDGMFRNKIGEIAEALVKERIVNWLDARSMILASEPDDGPGLFRVSDNVEMHYGSEPDIAFHREGNLIATIEIKGGTDPAGALERLGAMTKSFAETPPGCVNFLVAGVITPEMRTRLNDIGVVKVYQLSSLAQDGTDWDDFTQEVFHHAVRIY